MTRWTTFLAAFLLPVLAGAQPAGIATENPSLERLQVEIWPEYDRPAALVIVNGVLSPEVALPAPITLRIPGTSGGAHAVAGAAREDAPLLNVEHTQKSAGEFILLSFKAPERFFHVEFYEPLATQASERGYTYVWPGDFATARAALMLQEPAGASEFSAQPEAHATATGENGLRYRSSELGPLDAGQTFKVQLSYSKTDTRTSAEILQPIAAAPAPAAVSRQPPVWLYGAGAVLLVLGAAGAFITWHERRSRRAAAPAESIAFCAKCSARTAAGDRFCAQCGAPLGVAQRAKARRKR
jgi:hypothetical protein